MIKLNGKVGIYKSAILTVGVVFVSICGTLAYEAVRVTNLNNRVNAEIGALSEKYDKLVEEKNKLQDNITEKNEKILELEYSNGELEKKLK